MELRRVINENQGTENKLTRENDANKWARLPVAIRYYRLDGRELLQELEKKDLLIACYLVIKQEFGSIRWSNYVETESMW